MKLVAAVEQILTAQPIGKLFKIYAKTFFQIKLTLEVLEIKQLPAFNEPGGKLAPAEVQAFSKKPCCR